MARDSKGAILVTGGAGYVGSHTVCLLLSQTNHEVVVVDNCTHLASPEAEQIDANGNILPDDNVLPESLRRVELLAKRKLAAYYSLDLARDAPISSSPLNFNCSSSKQASGVGGGLDAVFHKHQNIVAVIHFAALKSVNESIGMPLEYYTNNLVGTINLLNCMRRHSCRKLIFSSSATVYGLPKYNPVDERHPTGQNLLNPYGRTKSMIEDMLRDLCRPKVVAQPQPQQVLWSVIALRYFNPVGAHPSGHIGEHIQGVPNNLMPYISQVSIRKREKFYIYGNDFDTVDGTGVRDYIHIMDLASGHLHALDALLSASYEADPKASIKFYNLGTGRGYSVLETIKTFESVNKVSIPYEITGRREGDAGEVYADVTLARQELGWTAKLGLVDMVRDVYRWQSSYPDGFKSPMLKTLTSSLYSPTPRID